jgi:ribosome-binding protein aMBF1 (putative translation factor)
MDWKAVISELVSRGMSQKSIAASVPCAQSTISDIARGTTTNPGWQIASSLQALLKKTARRKAKVKAEATV